MKRIFIGLTLISMASSIIYAQDDFDDIYYNPNASSKSASLSDNKKKSKKNKPSNYIADFSDMDVDEYNRRGFYYETDIDTIGQRAENTEDFVYTQQIQKYYNPTIVVDNSDILADILENSYGNVNIEIRNNTPVFASVYGDWGFGGVYYNWNYRPAWTWNYAWYPYGWSWNFGPAWAWSGPSWWWGYNVAWSNPWAFGPWYPPYHHHHHHAHWPGHWPYYANNYRPGASRPTSAGAGWSHNYRPTANHSRPSGRYPGGANRPTRPNKLDILQNGHKGLASTKDKVFNAAGNRVGTSVRNRVSATKEANAIGVNNSATTTTQNRVSNNEATTTRNRATSERKDSYTVNSARNSEVTKTDRRSTSGSYNRSTNSGSSTRTHNSGSSSRSYNSGSSNRSYNSGSSSRSYNSGSSSRGFGGGGSSRGGGGSHGGGRGGRR